MRAKTSFLFQAGVQEAAGWLGRCPDCGRWNSMKEERLAVAGKGRPSALPGVSAKATSIDAIEMVGENRLQTGCGEFDRVLGGGVVPGSVLVIGGGPGSGRTPLLAQALPRVGAVRE